MVKSDPTLNPAWQALKTQRKVLAKTSMRELFAKDKKRFERFSVNAAGILLDYSKNRITPDTMKQLIKLARNSPLQTAIEAMFEGVEINRLVQQHERAKDSVQPCKTCVWQGDPVAHTCGAKGFARLQRLDYGTGIHTIGMKRQLTNIMEQALLA